MGEVTVQLEEAGRKVVGRGASTDVIEASAKAYIDGLNKLASLDTSARRITVEG
jgi:2-isopropylmalate synthase